MKKIVLITTAIVLSTQLIASDKLAEAQALESKVKYKKSSIGSSFS